MDVKSRIKYFMKVKKMNVYTLSKKSGVTQPCITNWFNERNYTPSVDALEKICSGFEITMARLFCGDDEQLLPVTPDERELLNVWQILDGEQRQKLLSFLKSVVK